MLNNIKGFHIEPTNICTLKCPRCSRTKFIEDFKMKNWGNQQLDFVDFKNFFDIDLTELLFTLCGNYGDPIYYDNLIPMVQWLKNKKANIKIVTNGSYRKPIWWKELTDCLTKDDTIIFSIDGIPDNFTQYRINANWDSIRQGIDIAVKSQVSTTWKYIPFAFNTDSIEIAKSLSKELGIKNFEITPSDRWVDNDPLKPLEFVGERQESIVQWKKGNRKIDINPKCKNNKEHYISATGYYMPCCYVGDHRFYYKSEFYKDQELYDISKTTINTIANNMQTFYDSIELNSLDYCTFNCPKL